MRAKHKASADHKKAAAKPAAKFAAGLFVSFEGGEGSGKSTQIAAIAAALRQAGAQTLITREPGGTAGAEALRHILLNARDYVYTPLLEAILFTAARRDHVEQIIAPALAQGMIVLCDRFLDSTRVYQGLAGKLPKNTVDFLEAAAVEPYRPHISIFLDIDAKTGMARADKRRGAATAADRFEKDGLAVQEARRQAFLKIARAEPQRCKIIKAARPQADITADILRHIQEKTGLQPAAAPAAANSEQKQAANG